MRTELRLRRDYYYLNQSGNLLLTNHVYIKMSPGSVLDISKLIDRIFRGFFLSQQIAKSIVYTHVFLEAIIPVSSTLNRKTTCN
jgi:hypothetical protein